MNGFKVSQRRTNSAKDDENFANVLTDRSGTKYYAYRQLSGFCRACEELLDDMSTNGIAKTQSSEEEHVPLTF